MDKLKTLPLELKDIYQMLIAECRYGYTRNNHLMPWGAYDKVRRIVPEMYEVDAEYAIYTLKQICEECISDELMGHFYDGVDDEFENMNQTIVFINWCLDYIEKHDDTTIGNKWTPDCYDLYRQRWNEFLGLVHKNK